MTNTISIGELRQNPTRMLREVRAGATYVITDHGQPVVEVTARREPRWVPVERAPREARIVRLRTVLGAGLPFDDAAASAHETVCGLVLANGREVRGRAIDLTIAATAAAHGAAILTRNADDFAGPDGLVSVIVP